MKRKVLEEFVAKQRNWPKVGPTDKFYYLSLGTLYHSWEFKAHIDNIYAFFAGELLPDDDYMHMETDTAHYKVRIDDDPEATP